MTDTGLKVEGRTRYAESRPEVVTMAKKLHRDPLNGRRRSLRDVSQELAAAGHLTKAGKPYAAAAIAKMMGT